MSPREHERVRATLVAAFGDTVAVRDVARRYAVRAPLVVAPSVPYGARWAAARREAPPARGSAPNGAGGAP